MYVAAGLTSSPTSSNIWLCIVNKIHKTLQPIRKILCLCLVCFGSASGWFAGLHGRRDALLDDRQRQLMSIRALQNYSLVLQTSSKVYGAIYWSYNRTLVLTGSPFQLANQWPLVFSAADR
jgi:hypothetical protein